MTEKYTRQGISRQGILFNLVGPTAGGKTSLGQCLLEREHGTISLSISATSREPRVGEKDAMSYHFLGREEFECRLAKGDFFESEEIHGEFYGTLKKTVEDAISSGQDLLLDIDIKGALNFKKHYPNNTVIVFLIPPNSNELLRRLQARSSMSKEEIARRIETARFEYATVLAHVDAKTGVDYFLINDDFESSADNLHAVLVAERLRIGRVKSSFLEKVCEIQ